MTAVLEEALTRALAARSERKPNSVIQGLEGLHVMAV